MKAKPLVGVVMGSDSDLPLMEETLKTLEYFGIPYEVKVSSAHRSPKKIAEYAQSIEERGIEVVIAGAGGAAHLPGVIAAYTHLPVIGIPLPIPGLEGIDSLLSIVQMPGGVPVATVAIGKSGAVNAAILAAQILSLKYPQIREKIKRYKEELAKKVEEADSLVSRQIKEKRGRSWV